MKTALVLFLAVSILTAGSALCTAQTVYNNSFDSGAGPEWSDTRTDVTPAYDRRFLGQFGNQSTVLTLRDLPVHTQVNVSFDLYIIRSWDGNGDACCGPDVWNLDVVGGASLVRTSFSNTGNSGNWQSYPDRYHGHNPAESGAFSVDTLGYPAEGDAVYRMSISFPHTGPTVALRFYATGLEGVEWESWGLDNVRVEVSSRESSTPLVYDSLTYTSRTDYLRAFWLASDPSGIVEYRYAIGTAPDNLIVNWKSSGTTDTGTETGLSLESGKTYYWYVISRNGDGVWSPVGSSDGITVDATPPTQYMISTIGGNGTSGYSGDGGPATAATFGDVTSMAVDAAGNVYFTDYTNQHVRKIDTSGMMRDVAVGFAVFEDQSGRIYVQTSPSAGGISRVNPDGSLTPVPAVEAGISAAGTEPIMDARGNILWAVWDDRARVQSYSGGPMFGLSTTQVNNYVFAGNGLEGYNGDSIPALSAKLGSPAGIELDPRGNALIADTANARIRSVDYTTGYITTIAGNGTRGRSGDGGPALYATLTNPRCLHYDDSGNLYIADRDSNSIAMIDPSGRISTVVGRKAINWYWYNTFSGDGGPAAAADLSIPMAVTTDRAGSIYVADARNYRIRKATYATTAMAPVVRDEGIYTTSTDTLNMRWGSYDRESGIVDYWFAIGTTAGGTDARHWASAGKQMDCTLTGLSLEPGKTYYVSVQAQNGAGLWSPIGTSDGITVAVPATMAQARVLAPGTPVMISDAVVTFYGYAEGSNFTWFESSDRSSAIKALGQWNLNRGDKAVICGVPQWVDGTPILANPEVKTVTATGQTIRPLGSTVRSLANDPAESLDYVGVNPVGLLVTAWGRGASVDPNRQYFYIDDGSHLTDGTSTNGVPNVGIRVAFPTMILPGSPDGKMLKVSGLRTVCKITLETDTVINGRPRLAGEEVYIPEIKPREPSEVVFLN